MTLRLNRRPDEEGIKTSESDDIARAKQGLNRRPDEEGIKTAIRAAWDESGNDV